MDLRLILEALLAAHGVPGAVVGIVDANGGEVVSARTRGDGHGPVDDTIFRAAAGFISGV